MDIQRFGDSALIVDFGRGISLEVNAGVMAYYQHFLTEKLKGVTDIIPAYKSLTFVYNPIIITYEELQEKIKKVRLDISDIDKKVVKVPVCYQLAPDQDDFCRVSGLTWKEVIELHMSKVYHIYMMGFLPGFLYMGEVDEQIRLPRKNEPRKKVEAGSVGIADAQTGIYPITSPGGWNILGQTPIRLFDPFAQDPFPIEVGGSVQFFEVSKKEFATIAKDKHYKIERIDAS
ncbi:MAG: 5-oxoprolinase subunit PxpB [Bacteroidota bacterium]